MNFINAIRPLLLGFTMFAGLVSYSQVTVYSNGHLQVGESSNDSGAISAEIPVPVEAIGTSVALIPDTTATMSLIGNTAAGRNARISFGFRNEVQLWNSVNSGNQNDMLMIRSDGGFSFRRNAMPVMGYDPSIGYVDCPTPIESSVPFMAPQYLTLSDSRFKKDISSLADIGSVIEELTPVSYRLRRDSEQDNIKSRNSSASDGRIQYGFIAQEIKEILPDLVVEDELGNLRPRSPIYVNAGAVKRRVDVFAQ